MIKPAEFEWDLNKEDPMSIDIKLNGQILFSLFVGEAMELIGRELIMNHIAKIERSPWISTWHNQKQDGVQDEVMPTRASIPVNVLIVESERGWGQKVDSVKSFASKEEANEYITEFNSKNTSGTVPVWYMYAVLETEYWR